MMKEKILGFLRKVLQSRKMMAAIASGILVCIVSGTVWGYHVYKTNQQEVQTLKSEEEQDEQQKEIDNQYSEYQKQYDQAMFCIDRSIYAQETEREAKRSELEKYKVPIERQQLTEEEISEFQKLSEEVDKAYEESQKICEKRYQEVEQLYRREDGYYDETFLAGKEEKLQSYQKTISERDYRSAFSQLAELETSYLEYTDQRGQRNSESVANGTVENPGNQEISEGGKQPTGAQKATTTGRNEQNANPEQEKPVQEHSQNNQTNTMPEPPASQEVVPAVETPVPQSAESVKEPAVEPQTPSPASEESETSSSSYSYAGMTADEIIASPGNIEIYNQDGVVLYRTPDGGIIGSVNGHTGQQMTDEEFQTYLWISSSFWGK